MNKTKAYERPQPPEHADSLIISALKTDIENAAARASKLRAE